MASAICVNCVRVVQIEGWLTIRLSDAVHRNNALAEGYNLVSNLVHASQRYFLLLVGINVDLTKHDDVFV